MGSGGFRAICWGATTVILGMALTWRAVETHGRNVALYGHVLEVQEDFGRARAEQRKLRAEKAALERDPQYIEQRLRALRLAEPGEVILDRP